MENSISQDLVGGSPSELNDYVKGGIEALMFVSEKPVTLDQIKNVFETVSAADIKQTLQLLKNEYEQRHSGMTIVEIAGGYQMLSNPVYASYIRDFYKTKHKEKLSKPALETLAIVAYKQPVTRVDIELVRGVNSDGVISHLLTKELIKAVGRKDIPGRPFLYGTTKQFLEYFGLKSLDDLPKLEEFPSLLPPEEISQGDDDAGSSHDTSAPEANPHEGPAVSQEEAEPTPEAIRETPQGAENESF